MAMSEFEKKVATLAYMELGIKIASDDNIFQEPSIFLDQYRKLSKFDVHNHCEERKRK